MTKPAYDQLAEDFDLWQEYVDPNATVSEAELKALSHADRVAMIIETFGPEDQVPTVDEMLYEIHLLAPSGQRRTLHLQAQSPSHAQLSAIELAGLGPRAKVLQCHRLGEW
jgi:hypothetical protein